MQKIGHAARKTIEQYCNADISHKIFVQLLSSAVLSTYFFRAYHEHGLKIFKLGLLYKSNNFVALHSFITFFLIVTLKFYKADVGNHREKNWHDELLRWRGEERAVYLGRGRSLCGNASER